MGKLYWLTVKPDKEQKAWFGRMPLIRGEKFNRNHAVNRFRITRLALMEKRVESESYDDLAQDVV